MNNFRRDMWMVNIGFNIMGAFVGAIMHNVFLVVWSLGWLGLEIYIVTRGE